MGKSVSDNRKYHEGYIRGQFQVMYIYIIFNYGNIIKQIFQNMKFNSTYGLWKLRNIEIGTWKFELLIIVFFFLNFLNTCLFLFYKVFVFIL